MKTTLSLSTLLLSFIISINAGTYNICDYRAQGDSTTINTAAIQQLFQYISKDV